MCTCSERQLDDPAFFLSCKIICWQCSLCGSHCDWYIYVCMYRVSNKRLLRKLFKVDILFHFTFLIKTFLVLLANLRIFLNDYFSSFLSHFPPCLPPFPLFPIHNGNAFTSLKNCNAFFQDHHSSVWSKIREVLSDKVTIHYPTTLSDLKKDRKIERQKDRKIERQKDRKKK